MKMLVHYSFVFELLMELFRRLHLSLVSYKYYVFLSVSTLETFRIFFWFPVLWGTMTRCLSMDLFSSQWVCLIIWKCLFFTSGIFSWVISFTSYSWFYLFPFLQILIIWLLDLLDWFFSVFKKISFLQFSMILSFLLYGLQVFVYSSLIRLLSFHFCLPTLISTSSCLFSVFLLTALCFHLMSAKSPLLLLRI